MQIVSEDSVSSCKPGMCLLTHRIISGGVEMTVILIAIYLEAREVSVVSVPLSIHFLSEN